MTKVTSSSNRSKRKTTKPVSTDKGRQARAKVSQARVTSSGGGTPGSARVTQGGGGAKAQPAKAAASAARQPRALTNGNSATMRQIRAKAVQKQRMASGKTTVASRTPGPSAATRARISQTARSMKPIGDSARVRQATAQGQQAKASAQARRGARQAMSRMEGTLKAARTLRTIAGAAKTLGRGGVAAAVMSPTRVAPGTVSAAQGGRAPSRFANARDLAMQKAKAIKGSPVVGPRKSGGGSFDSAFASARKAGKSTFTWRGKKYTTKMKGE